MDRDAAYLEMVRSLEHYRSLPYTELVASTDEGPIESQISAGGETITVSVDVRPCSDDSVRIDVSAFGNNWWKTERIDESAVVTRDEAEHRVCRCARNHRNIGPKTSTDFRQ